MKLSEGERLILVMLAEIEKKLGIGSEVNPKVVSECVLGNQTWALGWEYSHIVGDHENPPDVQETSDILSMFDFIGSSYANLSAADKAKVDAEKPTYLTYQGFDANNDPHYSIARTMIGVLGRWSRYPADLNSHSSFTIGKYRAMLAAIGRYPVQHRPKLAVDELLAVLNAKP